MNFLKMEKEDKNFIFALGVFLVLMFSRFFDHYLRFHSAPMGIMQNYWFIYVVSIIFGAVLILFAGYIIRTVSAEKKKYMSYLITIVLMCLFSTFLCDSYYGSTDVYAWMIFAVVYVLIMEERALWLIVPAMFVMALISPMSVLSAGALTFVMLLQKTFDDKESLSNLVYLILSTVAELVGVYVTYRLNYFSIDAQGRMNYRMFIIMLLIMMPYFYVVFSFFLRLIREISIKQHVLYILVFFAGIPSAGIWSYLGDFNRSLIYIFVYYCFIIMFYIMKGDENFERNFNVTVVRIKQQLPIPEVVLIYLLMMLAYVMIGADEIVPEFMLTLVE